MTLATTQGREHALEKLAERRANQPEQIDNAKLPAGSPIYIYCKACGHLADALPESYTWKPPTLCKECLALSDCGWLE